MVHCKNHKQGFLIDNGKVSKDYVETGRTLEKKDTYKDYSRI